MDKVKKARAVGFNHVALEVGDIEEALAFYGSFRITSYNVCYTKLLRGEQ